jgi:CheY-like chemotaxis protein
MGRVDTLVPKPGPLEDYTVVINVESGPFAPESPNLWQNQASDGASRQLRVLVVEDEFSTGRSMAVLLRLAGHRVELAPDGHSALQNALLLAPDVVLLDLGLPGIDGWEVARRLQKQAIVQKPFLIALTGDASEAARRRSTEAGFYLHLLKPVDVDYLARLLRRFQEILPTGNEEAPTS